VCGSFDDERVNFRVCTVHQSHRNKTIMNDELGEVKAKIAATEIKLSKAEADKKEELVLSLTNLLVGLNQKDLLSAGEIYCIMQ
jgi:predicted aspartyl protease